MHSSVAAIADELNCTVPQELIGTRAAIFYLMGKDQVKTPTSISAEIEAAFGRTQRLNGALARLISTSEHPQRLSAAPLKQMRHQNVPDEFLF